MKLSFDNFSLFSIVLLISVTLIKLIINEERFFFFFKHDCKLMFDIRVFYGNSYKLIFWADYYRLEKLFALSYKPFECVIARNLIIIEFVKQMVT